LKSTGGDTRWQSLCLYLRSFIVSPWSGFTLAY